MIQEKKFLNEMMKMLLLDGEYKTIKVSDKHWKLLTEVILPKVKKAEGYFHHYYISLQAEYMGLEGK